MNKKKKEKVKEVIKKLKTQNFNLPDGSKVTLKVRPKLGDKTKIALKIDKKIDDVDMFLVVEGLPIRICKEGIVYNPEEKEYASFKFGATKKF